MMNGSRMVAMATVISLLALSRPAKSQVLYPMNEADWAGSAPQVLDTSGNGRDGTVHGSATTVLDAQFGRVGSFNGAGQYIAVGGSGSMSGARSIVAWINVPNSSLSGYGQPITTGGSPGAGDFFGISGAGAGDLWIGAGRLYVDHWWTAAYVSSGTITPDQWNCVAMTYDGAGQGRFYINGADAGSWGGWLYDYPLSSYVVGGNTIGGTTTHGSLTGLMSNFGIYDRQLTDVEIISLYGSAVPEPAHTALVSALALCGAGLIRSWRRARGAR